MITRTKTRARAVAVALVLGALIGEHPSAAADSPLGKWNTVDDKSGVIKSEVEVYEQGGKLYGKIVGLPEPNNAQGKPKVCIRCEGADRNQPIIGLVIIKDLDKSGDRYKGGTILDPEDGKVYKAEVWGEDGKLKVRGYLGPFYKTQTWVKAN